VETLRVSAISTSGSTTYYGGVLGAAVTYVCRHQRTIHNRSVDRYESKHDRQSFPDTEEIICGTR
jgi:hypothetical protein